MSTPAFAVPAAIPRLQRAALVAGGVGALLGLVGLATDARAFLQSYLFSFLFVGGIAIGCLSLVMLHHLTGGRWGFLIRRFVEAGTRTIPVVALLFVPLAVGMAKVYVWADASAVAADHALKEREALRYYLTPTLWVARAVFYFAVWGALAYFLNKWSMERDRTRDPALSDRLQALSGGGLLLMGLTITFSSVDWAMSVDPHWVSTIYGMKFMVGQVLSAMALCIVFVALLSTEEPLAEVASPQTVHDLGKLTFAFVMLWAYVALSQFLIIWSGNLPEEIPWYYRRFHNGWQFLSLFVVLFHFALPFLLLLSRGLKRNARTLAAVATFLLVMRLADLFWLIRPEFRGPGNADGLNPPFDLRWTDFAAPLAVGGLWLAAFAAQLRTRPLIAAGDPDGGAP